MGILTDFYNRIEKAVEEQIPPVLEEAARRAYGDYFAAMGKAIQTIFDNTIQEFYSSYTPDYYTRNESLYNLLQIEYSKTYIKIGFHPERMTPFRSGYTGEDGLYDQVFRKGWHGGAGSGRNHPEEGTPYWRTPEPGYNGRPVTYTDRSGIEHVNGYFRWGKKAEQFIEDGTETSPLEIIKRRFKDYEIKNGTDIFDAAYENHIDEMLKNFKLKV